MKTSESLPLSLGVPAIITGALSLFLLPSTFEKVCSAFSDEDAFLGSFVKVAGPIFILVLMGLVFASFIILFRLIRDNLKKYQDTKKKAEQGAAANP